MKIQNKKLFYSVIIISLLLFISSFIEINLEQGANYSVVDSLLGIIIFHNVYVLSSIILILSLMIAKSISF
ncbi:MAG TPA: hypothetical protein VHA12_01185 [Candidatus Nanoarchaeia archaeon]|nr:hypothetical protein [Candidatus Nanoarchaeia archaeon]